MMTSHFFNDFAAPLKPQKISLKDPKDIFERFKEHLQNIQRISLKYIKNKQKLFGNNIISAIRC